MKRPLFVCSRNRLRSPTAEQVFSARTDLEVASAGLTLDAKNPPTSELVEWADIIFFMEKAHRNKLAAIFKRSLNGQRVVCLNVPDRYEFMEPALIRIFIERVPKFLSSAGAI